jgi:hypothetical protein
LRRRRGLPIANRELDWQLAKPIALSHNVAHGAVTATALVVHPFEDADANIGVVDDEHVVLAVVIAM